MIKIHPSKTRENKHFPTNNPTPLKPQFKGRTVIPSKDKSPVDLAPQTINTKTVASLPKAIKIEQPSDNRFWKYGAAAIGICALSILGYAVNQSIKPSETDPLKKNETDSFKKPVWMFKDIPMPTWNETSVWLEAKGFYSDLLNYNFLPTNQEPACTSFASKAAEGNKNALGEYLKLAIGLQKPFEEMDTVVQKFRLESIKTYAADLLADENYDQFNLENLATFLKGRGHFVDSMACSLQLQSREKRIEGLRNLQKYLKTDHSEITNQPYRKQILEYVSAYLKKHDPN